MTATLRPQGAPAPVTAEPTCVATQRCTNTAAPNLLMCRGHLERLGAMLRDIESEAIILSAVPSMQQRSGARGGSPASERSPARLDVIAFRDPQTRRWTRDQLPRYTPPAPKSFGPWCLFCEHETCTAWRAGRQRDFHDDEQDAGSDRLMSVLNVLHGWARVVREDRSLAVPATITITGERDLLTRQLTWLAEQPWVDEFYSEIAELAAALKSLNGHRPDRPLSRCVVPTADRLCGGQIWEQEVARPAWAVLADRCERRYVDVADGPAVCDTCGATWATPEDKARLKLMIEQEHDERTRPRSAEGQRMLTVPELAQHLGKSVNAVRIILSRDRITGVDGYYDPTLFVKASA